MFYCVCSTEVFYCFLFVLLRKFFIHVLFVSVFYPAIDTTSFEPTIVNGKITYRPGIITFSRAQKGNLIQSNTDGAGGGGRLETLTYFSVFGTEWPKVYHDTEVKISNLKELDVYTLIY